MSRYRPPRGAAYIEAIFTKSGLARNGGPVRRSIAAIERNASLAAAYAAATAKGWTVTQRGLYWLFTDALIDTSRVIGIKPGGKPILAPVEA